MKITDTAGRSMLVDLMVQDASRWRLAPEHQLLGRGTHFVAVPHGPYAIKFESMIGVEAIVFENGKKLLQTQVGSRTQYLTADSEGRAFTFKPEDDATLNAPLSDVDIHADTTVGEERQEDLFASGQITAKQPEAPAGHGLVYVVVRFAKTNDPHGEPPQEEFEIAFQMLTPGDASEHLARHFHLLKQAPDLPNPLDPFSYKPAKPEELAHRPSRYCAFCKHAH